MAENPTELIKKIREKGMKVRSTSLSLPPTLPSSPSLSSYSSTPYSHTPLSFFHPSLKASLSVLDTLFFLLTFFPSLFLPLPSAPLLSPFPFPFPFPFLSPFLSPCLYLPFPLSAFSLPFLLPSPLPRLVLASSQGRQWRRWFPLSLLWTWFW